MQRQRKHDGCIGCGYGCLQLGYECTARDHLDAAALPVEEVACLLPVGSAQAHEVCATDTAPCGDLAFLLLTAEASVAVYLKPARGLHSMECEGLRMALSPTYNLV